VMRMRQIGDGRVAVEIEAGVIGGRCNGVFRSGHGGA
jgi:hypothetical protein